MAHNNNSASYENVLLCVLFLTFGFVFFDRLALSFLFPFMEQELQLSNSHLGMLSSVLALAWAVSGALVGAWSDRRGQRKPLLIVAVILFSLCSALSGLVGGFLSLLLFRGIMGLAEGPILPLSQSLMVEASSPHRRGLNMGLLQGSAAGLLGAVIGPPLLVALAEALGWRHAFIVSLLPGLLIAWLIWRHVRPDPPRAQRPAPRAEDAKGKRLALLKSRNILLCTLISCVFVTWFIVLISFTPTFLVNARGFSPATMGRLMSCLGVAWVVWGFAVPAISDRIGRRPTLVAFSLLAACCPLALLYAPNATSLGLLLLWSAPNPWVGLASAARLPPSCKETNHESTALARRPRPPPERTGTPGAAARRSRTGSRLLRHLRQRPARIPERPALDSPGRGAPAVRLPRAADPRP